MILFSDDYSAARTGFRAAASAAGARLSSLAIDAQGPGSEPLSIDIAWLGDGSAKKVLIHCSGLHGVEGFAGSAVQWQLLQQPPSLEADCALILIHILNPFGMSWLRRVNETNVDLNRNFIFAGRPRQMVAEAYVRLDPLLNPVYPPRCDFFYLKVLYSLLRYGYAPLKQAIACGQYAFPRGLFYGGGKLEQGPQLYHDWLTEQLHDPQRLLVLDLHTGLGAPGQESLLRSLAATPAAELSDWLGAEVSSEQQNNKVLGYRTSGSHELLYHKLFPRCRIDFITHEFGTWPSLPVLQALRAENQWHHFGAGGLDHPAKQRLKEAFCLPAESWRQRIVERGSALAIRGLKMLAARQD